MRNTQVRTQSPSGKLHVMAQEYHGETRCGKHITAWWRIVDAPERGPSDTCGTCLPRTGREDGKQ